MVKIQIRQLFYYSQNNLCPTNFKCYLRLPRKTKTNTNKQTKNISTGEKYKQNNTQKGKKGTT